MAGTRLDIDGRTVARCEAGPLDAEYALFEPSELELKATEHGNVREIGYRTTVRKARARLDSWGVTSSLVREAEAAFAPLAPVYARGGSARKVAARLGAAELFEGRELDAARRVYLGAWMDLPALAEDLVVSRAGAALQALHLRAVLDEVGDDAVVMIHTLELTRARRTGERTFQRPELDAAVQLPEALGVLAETSPTSPAERQAGPTRMELVDTMTDRLVWVATADARARLARIIASATVREQPARGPLADAELWALERQMSEGTAEGVLEKLEPLERARGRTPATTYLRARALLMGGLESPEIIAGRVSTLALSMSSFVELQLLAAQAWLLAGDGKRAAAYAKDLSTATAVDPDLRARALSIYVSSTTAAPPPPDTTPSVGEEDAETTPVRMPSLDQVTSPETQAAPMAPASASQPAPVRTVSHPPRQSVPYSTITGERATRTSARPKAPSTPAQEAPVDLPPRDAIASPLVPRIPEVPPASVPPSAGATGYMRGASQPPFRTEETAIGRGDKERRLEPLHSESAEFLSLPRMATGEPPDSDVVPRTPTEARILFTYLARELGEEYRAKRGVELRTDIAAIETMQSHLFDAYHGSDVRSLEDWLDVRRHGAFLSEILVRTLSAEWTDLAPRELGYWSMTLPPGTRVWPFARVLRYVAMGPRERDLVSYYLELKWRTR